MHDAGFDVVRLDQATFVIADLYGVLLGVTYQHTIWIDENAAGHGWQIGEVSGPVVSGEWTGRVDLLTVVTHEFGHILGFASFDPAVKPNDWMTATLPAGLRRLPVQAIAPQAQPLFPAGREEFAPSLSAVGQADALAALFSVSLGIEQSGAMPMAYSLPPETTQRLPEPALLFALDYTRSLDASPLSVQDFYLAEATSSGAGQEVLIGGVGSDLLIGVPGQDYLVGGFA
mgnify:CR=1 FL=1